MKRWIAWIVVVVVLVVAFELASTLSARQWRQSISWIVLLCIPATFVLVLLTWTRINQVIGWLRKLVGKHEDSDGRR